MEYRVKAQIDTETLKSLVVRSRGVVTSFELGGLGDADLFIKLGRTATAGAIYLWSARILHQLIDEKPPPLSVPWLHLSFAGEPPASEFREMVKKAL